jgi:hypothetical protein
MSLSITGRKAAILLACLQACLALSLSAPASASLGDNLDSAYRDVAYVKGSLQVVGTERYTICEIKVSTGTRVREFISPAGVVFAIAWEGPIVPELRQFLGSYFQKYSDALQAQKPRYLSRRPLYLHLPDLVFETGGRMGSYYGRAYIPQSMPEEVRAEEVN